MASILNAKTEDTVPKGAPSSKPSRIPVRTGHSSGSASDDSDHSSRSESKSRTGGKSRLPVPVKKVAYSSKPAKNSGSESDPEKNSAKGVEEKVVPATGNADIKKDNDTEVQPIKKMPARLKSLKLKKTTSVNQARCADPLARSVIPGINKKQELAKPSSDALAFMQQGRLRPARKFQPKKAPATDDSSEEEHERPSGGIGRQTSYRNIHKQSADEKKNKPAKKASTIGPKDPKKTQAPQSKSDARPSSSRTGTKNTTNTTTSKAKKGTEIEKKDSKDKKDGITRTLSDLNSGLYDGDSKDSEGAKSDRKSKESDVSESDNSLGLKPRKISFNYEAESDDPVSTASNASCASMEDERKRDNKTERLTNRLDYDEAYDVLSSASNASCAPMEAKGKSDKDTERLTNRLDYDEAYDVVSTASDASCAPMEAKGKSDNKTERLTNKLNYDEAYDVVSTASKASRAPMEAKGKSDNKTERLTNRLDYDEAYDVVASASDASCAPMEDERKSDNKTERLTNRLDYDEAYDVLSTASDASCAPMEAKGKSDKDTERLTNRLDYDEAYDVVSSASDASCAPMEAKSHGTNANELFMADIQWLKDRNIDFENCSDLSTTDSNSKKAPQKDEIQAEKNAQPDVPVPIEDHKDDQAGEVENKEDIFSDSFWDINPNKPEELKDHEPETGHHEEPVKEKRMDEKEAMKSIDEGYNKPEKSKDHEPETGHHEEPVIEKRMDEKEAKKSIDEGYDKPEQSKDEQDGVPYEEPVKNEKKMEEEAPRDDTEEGSFIEELEELLSAAEAEIEANEASLLATPKPQQMQATVPNLCVNGMITASNENNNTSGKQSGSPNHQPSEEVGSTRKEVAGGSSRGQGRSVGGSGDGDDPNDPKKPKPSKEPDDKKDEDDKKDKARAAKEAIAKQRKGNADEEDCLQEFKATQTEEEGNVAALYKTIRSKNNDLDVMKKLVENCRQDYEELQGSFDKYTNEFKEVDDNRAKISTLTRDVNFLKQENSLLKKELSQSQTEATQAKEKWKGLKITLSKMEVDFDFLATEKKELLTKLKMYEADTPPEKVETQKAEHKQEVKKSHLKHEPGRSSSLKDIEAMKVEEENVELKSKLQKCEKALKASEEVEKLKKTIASLQEKLAQDVIQIKQMKSKIESSDAERARLEADLRKNEEKLAETITYKDREISNLVSDNDKKELKNEELTGQIKVVLEGNDTLREHLQTWYQKCDRKEDKVKELNERIDELEEENENLHKELSEQRLKLLDARRERIENEEIPKIEMESLQNALRSKIASVADVIISVEEITNNDPYIEAHPCISDIECALQLLNDIHDLLKTKGQAFLKAIGCTCSCNGQTPGPSTEGQSAEEQEAPKRNFEEQERLMDELKERIEKLTQENHKLEKKVKRRKVKFSEDTRGGESYEVHQVQAQLKEKDMRIAEMEEEITRERAENEILSDYLDEVREKATFDTESFQSQNEKQTNHITRLQKDCANQRIIVQNLQGELSQCIEKNVTLNKMLKDIEVEKQELEEKLKAVEDSESTPRQTEIHLDHIKKLQEDCQKQRLVAKNLKDELAEFKSKNAALDTMVNEVSGQKQDLQQNLAAKSSENEVNLNTIQKLQEDCEQQRIVAKKISDELSELKDANESLDKKLKEVELEKEILEEKLEAVKDAESFRRQTDIHLNHIQKLQSDCENQRLSVKKLKSQVGELENNTTTLDNKLKDVEAEKYALEQRLKAMVQEIQKDAAMKEASTGKEEASLSGTSSACGESAAQIKKLQEFNEKLGEKVDMYEAFFQQVKEEKAQSMKALEASKQDAMTLKKKSDEQITELEKMLSDKNVLESNLQDTVASLEKRISVLEDEKADSESQLKAMVESLQRQNELDKSKEEWKQLELELQNSIMTLTTEKSEVLKELEEQKSVVAKATESLEIRMKELDECQQERQGLEEELECLKGTNSKLKEEMAKKLQKSGQDVDQRLAEIKLLKESSSEIIDELEKQLKDRQDSEIELKQRATTLNQQIVQLEAEKLEADAKIRALMECIDGKEIKAKQKSIEEVNELNEKISDMEFKMSELAKEKQKAHEDIVLERKDSEMKITSLEKRVQDQKDSETMLQEKIHSLELRISQLNAEKQQRDESMKTLMEAMNANKNIEEQLKNKGELEIKLSNKVEELRLKFSRIRSSKKKLERQLLKQRSEIATLSSKSRLHSKEHQDEMDALNERLIRVSERESEAKQTSDNKIKTLEKQLLSSGQSEGDLKERMASLEEKIARLETERSQHGRNISSIIRKLKSKEDLADAIAARDEAEREYNIKIDEMEIIVNKLRKEKSKEDCNEELKERYRMEYEESRSDVRKSTEKLNRCNERVQDLQAFITGTDKDEKSQDTRDITLHENIESLKQVIQASDLDLFKTLQSLKKKIAQLEGEKAEGQKTITAMLKSMEDQEKMHHCIETSREADKKILQQMNDMTEAINKLRHEKKLIEHELQDSKKLTSAKESESELLKTQTENKISRIEQSLKERYESDWEIQKRLQTMSEKLAQMENNKEQTNKTIQTMLESLQKKDNLEHCLEEKDKIENELKRRMQELKVENEEALGEARKYRVQCRDMHKMKEQITALKEQLLQMEYSKEKAVKSLERLLQEKEEELLQMEYSKEKAVKRLERLLQQKEEELLQMDNSKEKAVKRLEKLLQQKEEQLLQMERDKDRALENVNDLLEEKVQQTESDKHKALEKMKKLLQQKDEHLELVKKTLQDEVLKLKLEKKDLEIEKTQSQIETRNAFELIKKQSDDFNQSLNERNDSSERMMTEIENLKESLSTLAAERDELDETVKKYAKLTEECKEEVQKTAQREVELLHKLSDAQKVNEDLKLVQAKLEKTRSESVNSYKQKLKQLSETLELQSDQVRDLRHIIDSLKKQTTFLEDEKENVIQEGSKVVESLNMELEIQSRREIELREQLRIFQEEIDKLRKELDDQRKREAEMREEKTQEIRKIRSENNDTSETLQAKISELNRELTRYIAKESEMRVQIESARVEKEKLSNEVEELNHDKSSSAKASRKLINELRNSETELLEKVDELKLTVRTLEAEKRRVSMEYKDYQSDIWNITRPSRDANKRMLEDIKVLQQENNTLHAQLREMKLNESCLLKEKQLMGHQNQENEETTTKIKKIVQKQKAEIIGLKDRERELRDEIIDLKSKKMSTAEYQKPDKMYVDLETQSRREIELREQLRIFQEEIDKLRKELDDQTKREAEMREEKTQEIRKIRSENADTSETLQAKISELNRELTRYIAKENEMRFQIESAKVEKEKLLNEVEELKHDRS